MNKITIEKAFEMGREACLKGLPKSPPMNKEFWDLTYNINGHDEWKDIVNAYISGWYNEPSPRIYRSIRS